jgi:magnesium-transporting ATPase (P-type)
MNEFIKDIWTQMIETKKAIKKVCKDKVNAFAEGFEKKSESGKLSKKSIGILLRSNHIAAPAIFLIIAMCASFTYVTILAIFLLFVFLMFFIFDGCCLTMIENRFCDDEFTIVDPTLELNNLEITKDNRVFISYIIGTIYIFIIATIYVVRFFMGSGKDDSSQSPKAPA